MKSFRHSAAAGLLFALPVIAMGMPVPYAHSTPWTGLYLGAHAGINQSSASGLNTENSLTAGISGGYRIALANSTANPVILGGDVFADLNAQATHNANVTYGSDVIGLDVMAGYPIGQNQSWLPYVKAGLGNLQATGDIGGSDIGARLGIGVKYHLQPRISVGAQWMSQNANNITNDNFTVGVDYSLPMN